MSKLDKFPRTEETEETELPYKLSHIDRMRALAEKAKKGPNATTCDVEAIIRAAAMMQSGK